MVLDAVHADPVAARGPDERQGTLPADEIGWLRRTAVLVGIVWQDGNEVQLRVGPQGVGEGVRDLRRPQVWSSR
jgi:hypothetical protein